MIECWDLQARDVTVIMSDGGSGKRGFIEPENDVTGSHKPMILPIASSPPPRSTNTIIPRYVSNNNGKCLSGRMEY